MLTGRPMVNTRYTKLDPNHMAEVGPAGPDGQEIPVSLVYDQVALAGSILNRIVS